MANYLPFAVLDKIFDFLSPRDVEASMQVCAYWYAAGMNYLDSRRKRLAQGLMLCRGLEWKVLEPPPSIVNGLCDTCDSNNPSPTSIAPHLRRKHATSSSSQSLSFLNLPTPSIRSPGARKNSNFLYTKNFLYVFGGSTDSHTAYNDVWRFSLQSYLWERVATSGNPPSPRSNACCLLYGRHILLFGGILWQNNNQNESKLFLLDTVTHQWSQVQLTCATDSQHSLAYEYGLAGNGGGAAGGSGGGGGGENFDMISADLEFFKFSLLRCRSLRITMEHGVVRESLSSSSSADSHFSVFSSNSTSIASSSAATSLFTKNNDNQQFLNTILYSKVWHESWLMDMGQRIGKSICVIKSKWLVIYGGLSRLAVQNRIKPATEEAAIQHAGIGLVDLSSGQYYYRLVKGSPPPVRMNHCAVAVNSSRMLIFGGQYIDGNSCTDYWILSCNEDQETGRLEWLWTPVQCKVPSSPSSSGLLRYEPPLVTSGQTVLLPSEEDDVDNNDTVAGGGGIPHHRQLVVCLCTENDDIHRDRLKKYRTPYSHLPPPPPHHNNSINFNRTSSTTTTNGSSSQSDHRDEPMDRGVTHQLEEPVSHLLPYHLLKCSANRPQQKLLNTLMLWPSYEVGLCVYVLNIAGLNHSSTISSPYCEWIRRQPSPSILIPSYWKHALLASNSSGDRLYMLSAPNFSPYDPRAPNEADGHNGPGPGGLGNNNEALDAPLLAPPRRVIPRVRNNFVSPVVDDRLYVCTLTLK